MNASQGTTPSPDDPKDAQLWSALDDWNKDFQAESQSLSYLLSLRTRPDDYAARDELEPVLARIATHLSKLECEIDYIRSRLNYQEMRFDQFQHLCLFVNNSQQRILQILAHLPPELKPAFSKPPPLLPTASSSASASASASTQSVRFDPSSSLDAKDLDSARSRDNTSNDDDNDDDNDDIENTRPGPPPRARTAKPNPKPKPKPKGRATATSAPPKQAKPKKSSSTTVTVRPVTKDELNAAPQYVRGRLTVDKIAAVATRLSEIATAKYTLMRKPSSALSSVELSQCSDFQQAEECEEAGGNKFLSDNDIKGFGNYRIDSTVKTAINVLRHVGILKEVRVKNSGRILIINE